MKANSLDDEADGRLIRRFAEGRDERAFARLVQRHGALVAGVCARRLHNRADADDAFQAVFLVLARKAHALRRQTSIAAWLHQVAVRVCLNERRAGRRRQLQLQQVAKRTREPARMDRLEELKRVIDEELAALPERLSEVLILCDLEGHTQNEVARRLAVPVGTVSSRLTRGRAAMRKRLTRHGLSIATGGVSFALAKCAEAAPRISPELVHTTVHNAHIFVAGTDAMKSTLGIKASTLANGALHAMLISQWKTAACLVALLATSLFGGAVAPAVVPGLINSASAGTYFYDDFEDGSATDGSPVTWVPVPGFSAGSQTIDNGELTLTPDYVGFENELDVEVEGMTFSDVSLRTRVRCDPGGYAFMFARSNIGHVDDDRNYEVWGSIRQSDGLLIIAYANNKGGVLLDSMDTDLNVAAQDVNLQLDVFGETLSMTAWAEGEARPTQPQLEANLANATDVLGNHYDEGAIGLFVLTPPVTAQPTTHRFEFFQAASSSEPNTSGDTNFDGQIDLEDLNAVRNHFGEGELGGPRVVGDAFPFNGVVDLEDLNLVRNHFGAGTEGVAAPEPKTASLAGGGAGLLCLGLFLGRRCWQ